MKKLLSAMLALSLMASSAGATHYYTPAPVTPKPKPVQLDYGRHGHASANITMGAALWAIGCPAVMLLGTAAYVGKTQRRELTLREAHMTVWGCILPIVGPYLFDQLYQKNGWARYEKTFTGH